MSDEHAIKFACSIDAEDTIRVSHCSVGKPNPGSLDETFCFEVRGTGDDPYLSRDDAIALARWILKETE